MHSKAQFGTVFAREAVEVVSCDAGKLYTEHDDTNRSIAVDSRCVEKESILGQLCILRSEHERCPRIASSLTQRQVYRGKLPQENRISVKNHPKRVAE